LAFKFNAHALAYRPLRIDSRAIGRTANAAPPTEFEFVPNAPVNAANVFLLRSTQFDPAKPSALHLGYSIAKNPIMKRLIPNAPTQEIRFYRYFGSLIDSPSLAVSRSKIFGVNLSTSD